MHPTAAAIPQNAKKPIAKRLFCKALSPAVRYRGAACTLLARFGPVSGGLHAKGGAEYLGHGLRMRLD